MCVQCNAKTCVWCGMGDGVQGKKMRNEGDVIECKVKEWKTDRVALTLKQYRQKIIIIPSSSAQKLLEIFDISDTCMT